jgi:hypothetical protein
MTQGFGQREIWAERSLEKSSRELKMLRKVIEQYKDDPKGRAKMLKKMKKYWNSNIAAVKSLDYKPKGKDWSLSEELAQDIAAIQEQFKNSEDPREEVDVESIDSLTDEDMSRIRDMLDKHREGEGNGDGNQSAPEIQSLSPHGEDS